MDEDDDTRSHTSIGSEPHSPPSGQITVTVAAAPPSTTPSSSSQQLPPQLSQSSLTLALPIQQSPRPLAILAPGGGSGGVSGGSGGGGGGGGGGREDCWSEGATSVLIDAWGERYMELSRGNLKQKHWKEVADIVSSREDFTKVPKTDIQCKNRIDTVKKKYKVEKQKVASGCGPSRWPFFDRLDRLIGPAASTPNTTAKGLGPGLGPLSTATVSTGGPLPHGKVVPVGIPVGVRQHHQQPLPLPFPPHYLQTPPHLQQSPHPQLRPQQLQQQQRQQQLQQQQLRQSLQFSPPSGIPQMRYHNNMNMNTSGSGTTSNVSRIQQLEQIQKHQQQFRRVPPPVESDSDQEEWSHDSGDSLPPERTGFDRRKRPRMDVNRGGERRKGKGKGRDKKAAVKVWGSSVRDLTRAIMKFGEAYEAAESAKLQHIVEMEMQRMKFAKELELQRMKFMMKTQLELSQLNNGSNNSDSRGGGGGSGGGVGGGESNHMNHLHENHMNHANSDSSN